jgi:N-acetylneuraminate synthase
MIEWIADISSNHEGSIDKAYKLIKSAKESGATITKFQHWVTRRFINKQAFNNLKIGHQKDWGQSVYDIYQKYEIPLEWIPKLKKCCDDNNIEFMLSEYDLQSFDFTNQFVKRHKIGSGDINYFPMLEKVFKTGKQVFIAFGASNYKEIKEFLTGAYQFSNHIIFKCNTNYSSDDNENIKFLNLKSIESLYDYYGNECYECLKPEYNIFDGLSDHTKLDLPIIISISLGVRYIERHFKLEDNSSPDSKFSLNPEEWKHMVKIGNDTLTALGDGIQKIEENEKETRGIQRRSAFNQMRPDIEYLKINGFYNG